MQSFDFKVEYFSHAFLIDNVRVEANSYEDAVELVKKREYTVLSTELGDVIEEFEPHAIYDDNGDVIYEDN